MSDVWNYSYDTKGYSDEQAHGAQVVSSTPKVGHVEVIPLGTYVHQLTMTVTWRW